jgi:transposase
LPRDRRVYELSGAECLCQCCGKARLVIGQEVNERLDYEPASLMVIEHVRLTYACPACEKQRQADTPAAPTAAATANTATGSFSAAELNDPTTMSLNPERPAASTFRTAPRPPSPIPRGLAGPGLLAHLIVSKFCDHLPLYRSERMPDRFGVDLARSTLCDWLARSAELLRPLWELLKARVPQSQELPRAEFEALRLRLRQEKSVPPTGVPPTVCGRGRGPALPKSVAARLSVEQAATGRNP